MTTICLAISEDQLQEIFLGKFCISIFVSPNGDTHQK